MRMIILFINNLNLENLFLNQSIYSMFIVYQIIFYMGIIKHIIKQKIV
nr:MAG TPA: hypothetical protein [Caudoviricetes sp.]